MTACIDPDCNKSVYCRERCQQHYNRDVRNGTLALDKSYHDPLPPAPCEVDGCGRNIRNDKNGGKGMCGLHYLRWKTHGNPLYVREPAALAACTVEGCHRSALARALCRTHYERWRKHGDPTIVLKPDYSRRGPSPRRSVQHRSKHWSCGHARACNCVGATGACSSCQKVFSKSDYGVTYRSYVPTTCRPCLARIKRKRRATDPEVARREREARRKAYHRTERIVRYLRARAYEHLRSNLPGRHTEREAEELFERYNWLCGYCGIRPATQMDHIIPAILHGMEAEQRRLGVQAPTNSIDNFMPACKQCNLEKGSRTVAQWRSSEPMVRRGDIEFPPRQHKAMRGPRDDTVKLYESILALLDSGLSGVDIARQLNTHTSVVTKARQWAGRPRGTRPRRPQRICENPGCGRPHKARGLCQWHAILKKRAERSFALPSRV